MSSSRAARKRVVGVAFDVVRVRLGLPAGGVECARRDQALDIAERVVFPLRRERAASVERLDWSFDFAPRSSKVYVVLTFDAASVPLRSDLAVLVVGRLPVICASASAAFVWRWAASYSNFVVCVAAV